MRSELDAPDAARFDSVATDYCEFLGRADRLSLTELLTAVERLLPLLYHAAACLPIVEPETSEVPRASIPGAEVTRIQTALARLLGRWDYYSEVFNPADRAEVDPVGSLLSGDLTEIYQDLRQSLALTNLESVGPGDILWQWRFDFSNHWGRHAVSALRMVNALLYMEFVDALDQAGEAQ